MQKNIHKLHLKYIETEVYKITLTNSEQNVPGIEPNLIIQLFGSQNKSGIILYSCLGLYSSKVISGV